MREYDDFSLRFSIAVDKGVVVFSEHRSTDRLCSMLIRQSPPTYSLVTNMVCFYVSYFVL